VTKLPSLKYCAAAFFFAILIIIGDAFAQTKPIERTFSNPIAEVQQVVDDLKPSSSGRLPILEGFVDVGDQPLKGYEHGYYVCTLQVLSAPSGGTSVRITSKITAWYTDPESTHSGYRELTSNGHVEADLLDRIEDVLAHKAVTHSPGSTIRLPQPGPLYVPSPATQPGSKTPATPAPVSNANSSQPESNSASSPSANGELSATRNAPATPGHPAKSPAVAVGPASEESLESIQARRKAAEEKARQVSADIKGLEEIQKNQVRPVDLVVVKKPAVAILSKPEEGAQVLLTADQEDEFQILDLEGSWVHVQISGASRGWMRRSQVELPSGNNAVGTKSGSALPATADLFKVAREETNAFSGKWEPLNGKTVKVVWIEPVAGTSSSAAQKQKFAKYLLLKTYRDMSESQQKVDGVVIIFDSADGGQIAVTMENLKTLQEGSINDAAFWQACSLDPPEAFQLSAKP
jgi:hypothetical protein